MLWEYWSLAQPQPSLTVDSIDPCLQNDSFACSQTCLITLDLLHYYWAVSCPVLPSSNLILVLICGFTLWLDLRSTILPWIHLIIWIPCWLWLPYLSPYCSSSLASVGFGLCHASLVLCSTPGSPSLKEQPVLTAPWKVYPKHCYHCCFSELLSSSYRKTQTIHLTFQTHDLNLIYALNSAKTLLQNILMTGNEQNAPIQNNCVFLLGHLTKSSAS